MVIFLLALIGTIIVMAILTIGRLGFGRREAFNPRRFFRWFASFFVINYLICLAILYFSEPAFTGPFGGWQWLLWPLVWLGLWLLRSWAGRDLIADLAASARQRLRPRRRLPQA